MIRKFHFFTLLLLTNSFLIHAQVMVTEDIDYIRDIDYANDKDLLDIYMPEGEKEVPVIVYFHGGALMMGDKSWGRDIGHKLARSGIGLVSVNYRLSPEFRHPDHVNDAVAALVWVIQNIQSYGGNPGMIYVGGHSAGAYLAALLALDASLLQNRGAGEFKISGTVLISPFLYVEETASDRIERDTVYRTIWGNDPQHWQKASVTPHIGPGRDNILLIYADGDEAWRKDQNERFARAMTDAGNLRIFTKEVPNRTHLSLLSAITEDDDQIGQLIRDFIRKG